MPELVTKMYEFRKALNIQQAELAEKVGVRRETIGKLENGKYNPSLKLAMDIAKIFGVTVEEVFFFPEEEETEDDEYTKARGLTLWPLLFFRLNCSTFPNT